MFTLFSYILKIIFSIAATYFILYFLNKNETFEIKDSKNIMLFVLLISSFINLFFVFSFSTDNYTLYIVGIFTLSVFLFLLSKGKRPIYNILLFLCYFCVISISMGYILYTIIILFLYYLIDKNYYFVDHHNHDENNRLKNIEIENDE